MARKTALYGHHSSASSNFGITAHTVLKFLQYPKMKDAQAHHWCCASFFVCADQRKARTSYTYIINILAKADRIWNGIRDFIGYFLLLGYVIHQVMYVIHVPEMTMHHKWRHWLNGQIMRNNSRLLRIAQFVCGWATISLVAVHLQFFIKCVTPRQTVYNCSTSAHGCDLHLFKNHLNIICVLRRTLSAL